MAKGKLVGKAIKAISGKMSAKPKKPTKEQQKRTAERQLAAEKRRKEAMRGIVEDFKKERAKKKPLQKKPTTIREANEKARYHHAATVKALTRQQAVIRREAKAAGMSVKAYKEKFSNRASVKKLKELQKQNEAVRNKKFNKGGTVKKK